MRTFRGRYYWRLGGIFGAVFLRVFLVLGVQWILMIGSNRQ